MCVKFKCAINLPEVTGTHCPEVAAKSCKAGSRSTLIAAFCSGHAEGEMGQIKEFLYKTVLSVLVTFSCLIQPTVQRRQAAS